MFVGVSGYGVMEESSNLYIGTYTQPIRFGTGSVLNGKGQGVYRYRLDETTGRLEYIGVSQGITNPSYLVVSPSKRNLYVVNELKLFEGQPTGTISAFSLDSESGDLIFLNRRPTTGTDPCHVSTDDQGRFVFVANFMSGSVAVYTTAQDGSLAEQSDFVQHHGCSIDPIRQRGPHAHSVTYDASTELLFVPDLGLDRLIVYQLNTENGTLERYSDLDLMMTQGAGPRHMEIHPNGKTAFLINELNSTVAVLAFDPNKPKLRVIQTVSLLPDGFRGDSTASDIHIAPSGRFLYASNRGHDSIVGFAVDECTGKLTHIGYTPVKGNTPRNFVISPGERILLVANQDSDSIVSFQIDRASGALVPTGFSASVPTPVCIKVC